MCGCVCSTYRNYSVAAFVRDFRCGGCMHSWESLSMWSSARNQLRKKQQQQYYEFGSEWFTVCEHVVLLRSEAAVGIDRCVRLTRFLTQFVPISSIFWLYASNEEYSLFVDLDFYFRLTSNFFLLHFQLPKVKHDNNPNISSIFTTRGDSEQWQQEKKTLEIERALVNCVCLCGCWAKTNHEVRFDCFPGASRCYASISICESFIWHFWQFRNCIQLMTIFEHTFRPLDSFVDIRCVCIVYDAELWVGCEFRLSETSRKRHKTNHRLSIPFRSGCLPESTDGRLPK